MELGTDGHIIINKAAVESKTVSSPLSLTAISLWAHRPEHQGPLTKAPPLIGSTSNWGGEGTPQPAKLQASLLVLI